MKKLEKIKKETTGLEHSTIEFKEFSLMES